MSARLLFIYLESGSALNYIVLSSLQFYQWWVNVIKKRKYRDL
jgi:hypothetical protein